MRKHYKNDSQLRMRPQLTLYLMNVSSGRWLQTTRPILHVLYAVPGEAGMAPDVSFFVMYTVYIKCESLNNDYAGMKCA